MRIETSHKRVRLGYSIAKDELRLLHINYECPMTEAVHKEGKEETEGEKKGQTWFITLRFLDSLQRVSPLF